MGKQKNIKEAVDQGFLDLARWADNMLDRLRINYRTQNVWPEGFPGPYRGYRNTPLAKKSTGDSYRKLRSKVHAGAGGDTEKISFFFNYYLFFVDMGVGAGQKIEDVERNRFADYKQLYEEWKGTGDRQSRPFLMMELRHQLYKLQAIITAYYGWRTINWIEMYLEGENADKKEL